MASKIRIARAESLRVGANIVIVGATNVTVEIASGDRGTQVFIKERREGRRFAEIAKQPEDASVIQRRLTDASPVTAEMRVAAVRSFLAEADMSRLEEALAKVYLAMDAIRRRR